MTSDNGGVKLREWRCVECKRVFECDVEPVRCPIGDCRSRTFAEIVTRPSPSPVDNAGEGLREAARRVLEWWPEGSENSRQSAAMSSGWGDDIRALRAALQQEQK